MAALHSQPPTLLPSAPAPRPLPVSPRGGAQRDKMAQPPVPLKDMKLLDVKLGQLSSWLAMRDFTPGGIVGAFRRGYDRYYNKYINVKKGGLGGISMVLAGYVVISYIWSYSHLKHDRRRKYH
uniref:ATP synthase F(0) complex subunit f, mitochondrial n=1 Tax=Pavo cristatus TaxID=9049 RepID=A0A8C9ESZ6_PAVCR